MKRLSTALVPLLAAAALTACERTPLTQPEGATADASRGGGPADARFCQDGQTIVGLAATLAAETGQFESLVAAVKRAGLVDALDGPEHVTVFAPTDAAFADLLETLGVESLNKVDPATLRGVLLYHVTSGDRRARSIVNAEKIRMKTGDFVGVDGTTLMPARGGDASIVKTDVEACNGFIHVIDSVLLPPTG